MTDTQTLSLSAIEDLAFRALVAAGTSEANARPLAVATAMTEADGVASHGLAYIPIYCEHVKCGKVDGAAQPILDRPFPGTIRVDACTGFAHPAIDLGFSELGPDEKTDSFITCGCQSSSGTCQSFVAGCGPAQRTLDCGRVRHCRHHTRSLLQQSNVSCGTFDRWFCGDCRDSRELFGWPGLRSRTRNSGTRIPDSGLWFSTGYI